MDQFFNRILAFLDERNGLILRMVIFVNNVSYMNKMVILKQVFKAPRISLTDKWFEYLLIIYKYSKST